MGVGKTSLFQCFKGKTPCFPYRPTFVGDHTIRTIEIPDERQVKLLIWDTAGSQRFSSFSQNTVRDTSCCLMTFSLNERESFNAIVSYWWPKVKEWCPNPSGLLVGNKLDCNERAVSPTEIKSFCNAERLRYIETSALSGENITECLHLAVEQSERMRQRELGEDFMDSFQLYDIDEGKKIKRKCCA